MSECIFCDGRKKLFKHVDGTIRRLSGMVEEASLATSAYGRLIQCHHCKAHMTFVVRHFVSGEYVIASVHVWLSDKTLACLGTLRMDAPTWEEFHSMIDADNLGPVPCHFEEVVKYTPLTPG